MSLLEFATWLQATPPSIAIQTHAWIVPTLQSIHIVMIGVVFVSILMVALRVLGRVRTADSLAQVWDRFAPWLWTGVVVMALTGILLTVSEPVREFMTLSYRLKMILLVIAVASAIAFGRSVRGAAARPLPSSGRLCAGAVLTVVLWLAIIFLGRAIAYDDVIWGSWSPAVLGGADST